MNTLRAAGLVGGVIYGLEGLLASFKFTQ